ncbi:hypothetical protein ACI65C_008951 [Semiaphis heraclei]
MEIFVISIMSKLSKTFFVLFLIVGMFAFSSNSAISNTNYKEQNMTSALNFVFSPIPQRTIEGAKANNCSACHPSLQYFIQEIKRSLKKLKKQMSNQRNNQWPKELPMTFCSSVASKIVHYRKLKSVISKFKIQNTELKKCTECHSDNAKSWKFFFYERVLN